MALLKFGKDDSLTDILKKISDSSEEKLDLEIDSDSPIVKNPLNFRLLEKLAAQKGKEIKLSEVSPTGEVEEIKEEVLEENLGFVEADTQEEKEIEKASEGPLEDVIQEPKEDTLSLTPDLIPTAEETPPQFGIENTSPPQTPVPPENESIKEGFLPTSKFKIPKLPDWRKFDLKKLKLNRRNLLLGAAALAFILIFFTLFYLLPSADVELIVESQSLEKQATVTATPRLDSIDVQTSSIPLTSVEIKETGSLSSKVSGKKDMGEAAKGKVTVRNYSTSTEKTLVKGTILSQVGKSTVQFSLDRAVTVPTGSASSSVDSSGRLVSVIDPGRLDVEATASKIGSAGNISSGTRLSVANQGLDITDAVANGDFSGGNSKEVTVVSSGDRTNLLATLSAQLSDKAREEIKKKLTEGQKLPEGGINVTVTKKTYSKDIDQEATELSLDLEVTATGNVYNEKDLAKLMTLSAKQELPEGFKVSEDDTTATAEVLKINDDKTVTLLSKLKSKLVPEIKKEEIISNLKGKSVNKAKDYLQGLNNIKDVNITLRPQILTFLKSFPTNGNRIKVEIITRD